MMSLFGGLWSIATNRIICEVGVNLPQYSKAILMSAENDNIILVQQLTKYCHIAENDTIIYQNAIWRENTTTQNPLRLAQSKRCCLSGYICRIHSPMVTMGTELAALDTFEVVGITFDTIDPGNIDILFIDAEGGERVMAEFCKQCAKEIWGDECPGDFSRRLRKRLICLSSMRGLRALPS